MASSSSGLTVTHGAALSIGAVLGTGVVALPAIGAQVAGPASLISWLVLILASIPLAGTFAALGARHPDAGGVSTYVRRAFGARAAAVVGWCFYFAVPAGAPAAAMFGGAYVAAALGGGRTTTIVTSAVIILVVTVSNAKGIRLSGRVQVVLATLLIGLLVAATLAALPYVRLSNLTPFAPHGWWAIGPAAAVLVWGFAGWEAVTHLAGDFRNPRRDLPRSTVVAVLVVGVLYLAVASSTVLVLGPAAGTTDAPLADLLAVGFGGPVRLLTAAVALLLTVGTMNAYFAGAANLGTALARDGALPTGLGVGRRSLALVSTLALVSLVATSVTGLGVHTLVLLTTGAFVLVYVLGTAAALRLLPRRTWGYRGAVVAFVLTVGLLVVTGWHLAWALGIAVAALIYQSYRRRSTVELVRAG
jgi:amino acid efflux transporter